MVILFLQKQTYSTNNTNNTNTNIERIALVGCGTDGINQNLTQDFAKAICQYQMSLWNSHKPVSSFLISPLHA
jgi:hypothetical protein